MLRNKEKSIYKKIVLFLAGTFILIAGITLILIWWSDVVILFRGITGMILALCGLLVLYFLRE